MTGGKSFQETGSNRLESELAAEIQERGHRETRTKLGKRAKQKRYRPHALLLLFTLTAQSRLLA